MIMGLFVWKWSFVGKRNNFLYESGKEVFKNRKDEFIVVNEVSLWNIGNKGGGIVRIYIKLWKMDVRRWRNGEVFGKWKGSLGIRMNWFC